MSAPALRAVQPDATPGGGIESGWRQWLASRLDPSWRPGEWDERLALFTGDLSSERTAAWACRTPGCPSATRYHHRRCNNCRRSRASLGVGWDQFDADPPRHRLRPSDRGACLVPGCQGERHCVGLCFRHERSWRKDPAEPVASFAARARPLVRGGDCRVSGCGREAIAPRRGLCRFHDQRVHRRHDLSRFSAEQLASWIAAESPLLGIHQFSLAGLAPTVRLELRYALQCRDASPPPLDPSAMRILTRRLAGTQSMRDANAVAICASGGQQYDAMIRGLFRDLRRHLDQAWAAFTGVDPFGGDVWQVALLDLQTNASRRWPATRGVVDFRAVELPWLREVAKDWARATRPHLQRLRETLRACQSASVVLVAAGRTDPTELGAGDFTRIVAALREQHRDDGSLYSASHRNLLTHQFCEVIDHGRAAGLLADVPDTFRAVRRRWHVAEQANEDELGKALPESVIRQLDAHLHLLGPAGHAGSISGEQLRAMHQTIYRILRDTGRRPGEVTSLRIGCIEMIEDQHNLVYDNHKAGRMRRRLPITEETAATILDWQPQRERWSTPPAQRNWLFPSPLLRAQQSQGHLTASAVAGAFKAWVARIGRIDSELLGPDGSPVPYDPSLIVPYALRHSYAQRHADAGVPVDVLKELMDHVSVTTTMGYYRISLKRKQQAIRSVGALATDASGRPAPFTEPAAYERASVSVPFGNCTEPSNVKAGGGACPIRFQCAGCGFYRPDPSYLPALEQHIAELRAERETARAMQAADYVLANLTAQIESFTGAAETMRRRLAELGPAERADVEDASRLLRRARAARHLPLLPTPSAGHAG